MKSEGLLKKEYVKTIATLVIIFACFMLLWFGPKIILKTEHPFLVVSSGSMEPTLHIGDIIIVQGFSNASEINVNDVIVYWTQNSPHPIVHRVINKQFNNITSEWYFQTKGDANPSPDQLRPELSERYVIGKVIFRMPFIGHIALFAQKPYGRAILIIVIIALALYSFFPSLKKKILE